VSASGYLSDVPVEDLLRDAHFDGFHHLAGRDDDAGEGAGRWGGHFLGGSAWFGLVWAVWEERGRVMWWRALYPLLGCSAGLVGVRW